MFALRLAAIFLIIFCVSAYGREDMLLGSTTRNSSSDGPKHLFELPTEILLLIIHGIIGWKHDDIDITVPREKHHQRHIWMRGEERPPIFHCFKLYNFMLCSRRSRDLVLASFESYHTFYSDNTEGLRRLPKLLNPAWFPYMRKLSLKMDDFTKQNDELVFPGVLNVLCQDLKNLQELTLFSETSQTELLTPYTDHRDMKHSLTITRRQQEARTITRLMAHVVVRHKLLERLIFPASSGKVSGRSGENRTIKQFLIADAGQARRWESGDKVLNATDLCLKKWSELAVENLDDHVISPPPSTPNEDTPNSRVALHCGHYAPVFEQAYSLPRRGKLRICGNDSVDFMIGTCRALEARAQLEIDALRAHYNNMLSIDLQAQLACSIFDWKSDVGDSTYSQSISKRRRKNRGIDRRRGSKRARSDMFEDDSSGSDSYETDDTSIGTSDMYSADRNDSHDLFVPLDCCDGESDCSEISYTETMLSVSSQY